MAGSGVFMFLSCVIRSLESNRIEQRRRWRKVRSWVVRSGERGGGCLLHRKTRQK